MVVEKRKTFVTMDYEEKYKNALRRAKKLYEQGTITECLGWVFPEIKESANEEIRKAIMACCSDHGHKYQYTGITTQDMMCWLEKQGKQKPVWSEEDEKFFNDTIGYFEEVKNAIDHSAWVKSLKQRIVG